MRVAGAGMHRVGMRVLAVVAAVCVVSAGCEVIGGAEADGDGDADTREAKGGIAAAASLPPGMSADEVERGRELFLPCAVCHGLDGQGNQLGPSLRDGEWIHITGTLEEIERVIRDGVAVPEEYPVPMVPLGGGDFDAAELRAVASYVYAISHPARAAPPAP